MNIGDRYTTTKSGTTGTVVEIDAESSAPKWLRLCLMTDDGKIKWTTAPVNARPDTEGGKA
jgi:ribosomal protein S8E